MTLLPSAGHGHNGNAHSAAVDEVSKAIIEQLQEDGRRSYAAIGKAIGLSEAAVRQRVQKLIDSGIVQIVAVTNPLQLGFARQAMLGIKTAADLLEVSDKIAALDQVDYCLVTAGSFDILAEVICENDQDLLRLVNQIRGIPGVLSTETFMYLSLRKQEYNWGTR
ncbi:AsnC family transcriptional regulator [Arthrobacter sp.]|uniref:Lrp/AsnC family transcriptional regulator n=1 Tax=Arthrobacter sp. TaxID=1667 RepID=UPI0033992ACA